MPTTLFEAPQYDPARERRRNRLIVTLVVAAIILTALAWFYRNWPEEHVVSQFFSALVNKDYEKAYGIWMHDPQWKEHPGKYNQYPFNEFYKDWGPGGEWGIIRNFHIDGSVSPPHGSGVIVVVTVNGRADKARIWVEKKNKTLTFSPY